MSMLCSVFVFRVDVVCVGVGAFVFLCCLMCVVRLFVVCVSDVCMLCI